MSYQPHCPIPDRAPIKHSPLCYFTASYQNGGRPTHPFHYIWFPGPSKDSSTSPSRSLVSYCPSVQLPEAILSTFLRVVIYCSPWLLITRQIISLQEVWFSRNTKKRVVGLCVTLRNFTQEHVIALKTFLANLMDTFNKCAVFEGKAVQRLV